MSASERPIRVLLTKSGIDIHDRGIRYVAMKLRDAGMEVIYIQFAVPEEVADAALQEDVDAVGLSFSTGAHLPVVKRVTELLKARGKGDVVVLVGGIIPDGDVPELERMGVRGVFGPGSFAKDIIARLVESAGRGH